MPEERKKYGQNTLNLRGTVVKVAEKYIGQFGDVLLVNALIEIPGKESVMTVPVKAFGKIGRRLTATLGDWVHLEGRVEGREYEGKHYTENAIYEVWVKPQDQEEEPVGEEPEPKAESKEEPPASNEEPF
jgi:hypothetical protein